MITRLESVASTTDPRAQPAYPLAEAARYLRLPVATLRSWVVGREYPRAGGVEHFRPLIKPAQRRPPLLSFWDLIEAHVLRSLRTEHGVAMREVRSAIRFAEQELKLDRLLRHKELLTHGGDLLLARYGSLINLSKSGQLAMRKLLDEHLKRVEWDAWQFPIRLYPFVAGSMAGDRSIAIDPQIAFGRPIVRRAGVSTSTIADRIDAGELVADLADDYDLTSAEIEQAILYERAA